MAGSSSEDSPLRKEDARLFIALVKQRFHGKKSHTFQQFKALSPKHDQHSWLPADDDLHARVRTLFHGNDYLIRRFRSFLPNLTTSSDSDSDSDNFGGPDETRSASYALKLVNRVIEKGDKKLFKSCAGIVKGFSKHRDAVKLKEELFDQLRKYPDLKIDLSECLAEGMERESGPKRLERRQEMVKEGEDGMFDRDLSFHRIRLAKQACQRLIDMNQGDQMEEEEYIDVSKYFTVLDVKCLRENRTMAVTVRRLFSNQFQSRRRAAIEDCWEIVSYLESKMDETMRGWTEEKQAAFMNGIEQEEQIPLWDWH